MHELVDRVTIKKLVDTYDQVKQNINNVFLHIKDVEFLTKSIGSQFFSSHWWACRLNDREEVQTKALQEFWLYLMNQIHFEEFLSRKKKEALQEQIKKGDLPPFTVANIQAWLKDKADNFDELLLDTINQVFQDLTPQRSGFKSIDTEQVGNRMIFDYAWSHRRLDLDTQNKLRDLENVFSLLDGQGVVRYPGTAASLIHDAMNREETTAKNKYFEFRWFKKGTLHVYFLREDLVQKINQSGSKTLKEAVV